MSNNSLTVCDILIREDAEGRYFLNDLHKAAGGEKKHRPNYWLENQQTIDLIELIKSEQSIAGIPAILTKQGVGTFVVKPLVYAYAMWISPVFHLHVINAYDAMMSGYIPEHIIKAYEIIVENQPYVKPITAAISLEEYEARKSALTQGLQELSKAKILMTGMELETLRKSH
jgi:hypothetical protein